VEKKEEEMERENLERDWRLKGERERILGEEEEGCGGRWRQGKEKKEKKMKGKRKKRKR